MSKSIITATVAFVALGFSTGCENYQNMMAESAAVGGNVRYAENGTAYRLYEYFPNQQVYRSVYRYTYFWEENGVWRMGSELPNEIQLGQHFELIELPTGRPFDMHEEVVAQHPTNAMLTEQLARLESEAMIEAFASVPTNE